MRQINFKRKLFAAMPTGEPSATPVEIVIKGRDGNLYGYVAGSTALKCWDVTGKAVSEGVADIVHKTFREPLHVNVFRTSEGKYEFRTYGSELEAATKSNGRVGYGKIDIEFIEE